MENSRCISMPGLPLKVGNSGDMVWVRSTTVAKLLGAAIAALLITPVAAKPAAAVALTKPRRVTASRTARSHPAKHMSSPCFPPRPCRTRRSAGLWRQRRGPGNRWVGTLSWRCDEPVASRPPLRPYHAHAGDRRYFGARGRPAPDRAGDGADSLRCQGRLGRLPQEAPEGPESLIEIVLAGHRERSLLIAEAETATDPHRIADIQSRLA